MLGTFKLKLTEPQPLKKVLKHERVSEATKTCRIRISTDKLVNIYWGDGSVDEDIEGSKRLIVHNYKMDGVYYPIIAGCIDEIEQFETNAQELWNRL